MNEIERTLFAEGGTFNGKHFDSIADLFASLGTKIVCGASLKNSNYSWHGESSPEKKKKCRKKNKQERQRRKKGRK